MPSFTSAGSRVARLNVKPPPSTLSESFAILRKLKSYGAISTFVKKQAAGSSKFTDAAQKQTDASDTYTVVYTSINRQLQSLSDAGEHPLVFDVQANGKHPNPFDLDPYNVRGLLNRKPHPLPRTFSCTLTLTAPSSAQERQGETSLNRRNGFSESFVVDRDSVFGQILAETNAPPNLILGLLPKVNQQEKEEGSHDRHIENPTIGSVGQIGQANKRRRRGWPSRDLASFSLADLYRKANERPTN